VYQLVAMGRLIPECQREVHHHRAPVEQILSGGHGHEMTGLSIHEQIMMIIGDGDTKKSEYMTGFTRTPFDLH